VFEYHGWMNISAAPHETDTESRVTHAAVDYLRGLLDEITDAPGLRDLRWVNGSALCHFGGFQQSPQQHVGPPAGRCARRG
jgi:Immunity protein 7